MRVLVCGFAAPSERHCFASSCSASHHEPKPGTIAHAYPFGKSQLAVAPTMRPCAHLKRFDLLFSASLTAWPSPRTPQRSHSHRSAASKSHRPATRYLEKKQPRRQTATEHKSPYTFALRALFGSFPPAYSVSTVSV